MPLYTYECRTHGPCEIVCSYAERDLQTCEICKEPVKRAGVEPFKLGKPGYQMQAVMGDGSHVKGHFGKLAKTKRK